MSTRKKSKRGGACPCTQRGGKCSRSQKGGQCPCTQRGGLPNWLQESMNQTALAVKGTQVLKQVMPKFFTGGYKATAKDKEFLRKYRRGESIGFTMLASLKAKGLIPRTSKTMKGKKVLGSKYK